MQSAPLYATLAEAPPGGVARWVETADGVRLRIAHWDQGAKGTVIILPGRTEFIEKYGRAVGQFRDRDYASVVIDWRGQGLSDRLAPNRKLGHVVQFTDYQRDITAMLGALAGLDLPKPYYLCAHSMGGTIGLRALHSTLPVTRAVFSAPMWGLTIEPLWRPLVQALAGGSSTFGLGEEFAPGTGPENYLVTADFEDNRLTSSSETWDYLTRIVKARPGLEIGGPSINWLYQALDETKALQALDPPSHEMLCLIGSDEKVVHKSDVISYVERWKNGHVGIVSGARHEILMETPEIQKRAFDMMDAFFSG